MLLLLITLLLCNHFSFEFNAKIEHFFYSPKIFAVFLKKLAKKGLYGAVLRLIAEKNTYLGKNEYICTRYAKENRFLHYQKVYGDVHTLHPSYH